MGDIFVDIGIEMIVLVFAEIGTTEGQLQSEAINDVEFLPQSNLNNRISTRAAPSRSFCTVKQQSLKLKTGQLFFIRIGKTCSRLVGSLPEQP